MEGTAGIVDWQQVVGPGADYEIGRRLLLNEVNAAIDGALEGGATEIVVNDSHWTMRNLPPAELHGRLVHFRKAQAALHDAGPGRDVRCHLLHLPPRLGWGGRLDSLAYLYPSAITESAINALVASRVPVALITGDRQTVEESRRHMPDARAVRSRAPMRARAVPAGPKRASYRERERRLI